MAKYALVIGIAEYQSPHLKRLSKTTNDAETVAQLLERYGDFQRVIRLPARWNTEKNSYEMNNQKVTGAQLGQELRTFLLEQADNNEALIYFTGHGFTVADNLGTQKGYLATSDCQIEVVGDRIVEQKYAISLDSLNELIRDSHLNNLVVLLDCCHSGNFLERQLVKQTLTAFSSQKDYYLITACRGFEEAKVISSEANSVFSGAVIQGLGVENAGKNRRITGDRLFDYISSELKGSVQEPLRMGWGNSITLVNYPHVEIVQSEPTFNRANPYQGLYSFELDRATYFGGREQAIRALIDRLSRNRFLAVIGPSGCGKSSLIKAGLLPWLRRDYIPGSREWEFESFTPSKHPLGSLTEVLQRQHQRHQPYVLFIDQFEETFTLCEDETERQNFIRLMADEATSEQRQTRLIVAMRGDFLDRCAAYPQPANLINRAEPTTYMVTPMNIEELQEAIEKPAFLHGVKFEQGLVAQILSDVEDQPGALPLLQYALKELWRVCIEEPDSPEPILTKQGYEQIGGVKGALENRANLIYQSFNTADQAFVRRLFMELVQLGEGNEVSRRRANWDRLKAIADSKQQLEQVTELLSGQQQRLIITDDQTVQVAHEALLTEWKLVRNWIAEDKENIRISRQLEIYAQEWKKTFDKSESALLAGARLEVVHEWVEKNQPKLTPLEQEYVKKSIDKRDRDRLAEIEQVKQQLEQERQRRKAEKQRTLAVAVLGAAIAAFLGLFQAQRDKLYREQKEAINAQILKAEGEKNQDNLQALTSSIMALKMLGVKRVDATDNLVLDSLQKVVYGVNERDRIKAKNQVIGLSVHPQGKIIAYSVYQDGITLANLAEKTSKKLLSHTDWVRNVRFSPNGQLLASASFDKTVKLWKVNTKTLYKTLKGHQDAVLDVSFSSDNKTVASSSKDGSIKLWDIKKGRSYRTLLDRTIDPNNKYKNIYSLDFNLKDKTMLASSGSYDYKVSIWDLKSPKSNQSIYLGQQKDRHKDFIFIVRFSPDGKILASASQDGKIKLWRVRDKTLIGNINVNNKPNTIYGLGFNQYDGSIIASTSEDGIIRLWKVKDVENSFKLGQDLVIPFQTLTGHNLVVNRVEFNPKNQKMLISTSDDSTLRFWQTNLLNPNLSKLTLNDQAKLLLKDSCNLLSDYIVSKNLQDIREVCQKQNELFNSN
ncbi:MAG TPA: caspase family protein [Oculatellaceae cyanobacterium]|jgi:WD40 repeat protein/energy-coupling factor transporter ATP-binding protein EcfA2